jgi:hypothetical protein
MVPSMLGIRKGCFLVSAWGRFVSRLDPVWHNSFHDLLQPPFTKDLPSCSGVNSENQYGAMPCQSVRASRRYLRSADRSSGSAGV